MNGAATVDFRTAVVTGGSTHIGRAIAESLAAGGYLVYIASRDRVRCERVAGEISASHGRCHGLAVDITRDESVGDLFTRVLSETGRLDAVVCNAGGNPPVESGGEPDPATLIDLNLVGTARVAIAACRAMADRGGGAVIVIGSVHGSVGSDPRLYQGLDTFVRSGPGYHTAKAGVAHLARSLTAEYGRRGVRVNCVSPGVIAGSAIPDELAERIAARTPMARLGTATEVASVVRFLAGPDASWIAGQDISVDGGWTAW